MRELWVIGGIVGIGVAAAIALAVVLVTDGDDAPPLEVGPTATAAAAVQSVASRSFDAPTPSPTAAPPAYEAIAWDEPRRVQRLPPPTEAAALDERDVHRNGFAFGPAPPRFESVPGGEACQELTPGTPLRAGDWIVELESAEAGALIVLTPRASDFDRTHVSGAVPWLLRWIQLDGDRERTHVHEQFWGGPDRTFEAPLLLPDAGTWRAIATRGPNWGCFTLAVESHTVIPWLASSAKTLGSSYPTAKTPERIARFEELLERIGAWGTPARQCVLAEGLQWARSGEFVIGSDRLVADWSPDRRGSKVGWTPLNDQNLGPLTVVGAVADAPTHTYSYREPGPVQSGTADGEPTGQFLFVTSVNPPWPGEWLLVASADPGNWGCFRVNLGP